MAILLVQAVLPHQNGLPEDVTVNTFHFNGPATNTVATNLAGALDDFYNAGASAPERIRTYLSPDRDNALGAASFRFYDITSGPSGTPFAVVPWTIGAPAADDPLPQEVALCLSFKSTPLAGAVEARRRGRVYLGPLNRTALVNVGGDPRPSGDFIDAAVDAAQRLHTNADTGSGAPWVIYSRVNDTTSLVDIAWCDNAFDTQRRRGLAATTRTTLTL